MKHCENKRCDRRVQDGKRFCDECLRIQQQEFAKFRYEPHKGGVRQVRIN